MREHSLDNREKIFLNREIYRENSRDYHRNRKKRNGFGILWILFV